MNKNDTGLILLDRNDKPFFTFYQAKFRSFLPLSQMPTHMTKAVIASEDKDYYKHSGFSLPSLFRALFLDLSHGKILYGGSTITQQLVKNALLNANKNYLRKVQELILAQEIERRYSKDEILEMYLNSVYFGEGAFGVENAAQHYFGKPAKDLSIAQQAFLAGILPSPSSLSPFSGDFNKAKALQKIVLEKMYDQHYITKSEKDKAEKETLVFKPSTNGMNSTAPHFALMIRDELIKKYGEETIARSGFKVKTTLDLNWQKEAEKAVTDQVVKLKGDAVTNGAAVVMDPKTGDVKALVGSTSWYDEKFGKVNMATTPRSVGSSFKPIVYAAAIERRMITPATLLHDVPTSYPEGYHPVDFDRKFRGLVTVRRALSNSLNVPAVEVMHKVGLIGALEMAKRLGITSLKDPSFYGQGLTVVLGSGEVSLLQMTDVYATFANGGMRPEPRTILSITDKSMKTVYTSQVKKNYALEPEVAFLISSILSDNKARSEEFGNLLTISRTAAVKTGTAEDFKDALTLGYTPSLAIGVWVGNNDNHPMDSVAGSLGAAPIWKQLMEKFLANKPIESFSPPSGIVQATVCSNGQKLALNLPTGSPVASQSALTKTTGEYFIRGTEPQIHCQIPTPTIPSHIGNSNPNVTSYPYFPNNPYFSDYPNVTTYPYQTQEEFRKSMQEYRQQLREARRRQREEQFNNF